MKDDDTLLTTTATTTTMTTENAKKENSYSSLFGKCRYKFWAIGAILLLAFWALFTGTVTVWWFANNLNHFFDDLDSLIHNNLDDLEMKERDRMVKHMWDVYTNSRRIRLSRFCRFGKRRLKLPIRI
ncbi:hypothetical protein REPUB_Repub10bG0162200 [Reevesia pubescens]